MCLKTPYLPLHSYTGDKLNVLGSCVIICVKNNVYNLNFYVVNSNTESILSLETCINLNLIMKTDSVQSNINHYQV